MNKMENKVCSNCVLCSFVYPSSRIECDKDNHVIKNEMIETCESFDMCECECENDDLND